MATASRCDEAPNAARLYLARERGTADIRDELIGLNCDRLAQGARDQRSEFLDRARGQAAAVAYLSFFPHPSPSIAPH